MSSKQYKQIVRKLFDELVTVNAIRTSVTYADYTGIQPVYTVRGWDYSTRHVSSFNLRAEQKFAFVCVLNRRKQTEETLQSGQ